MTRSREPEALQAPLQYRAGLIGLGSISTDEPGAAADAVLGTAVPYSHASAMATVPSITVVAGCDVDSAARRRFADRWSARWPGVVIYASYAEMLAKERLELVAVATPDHLHTAAVLATIEAGVPMVLCEKPLTTSLDEATRIVSAARAADVTVAVNYTKRWTPEFVEARRLVRAGRLGGLTQIVIHHGGPRAMLYRTHTHVIDLMQYFAESEPEWVMAELEAGFEGYGTQYRGDGGYDPATEPGLNSYVAFRNGVRAYLMGVKASVDELRVDLIGPAARLTIDVEGVRVVSARSEDPRFKPPVTLIEHVTPRFSVSGMEAAVRDLISSREERRPTASPPESARIVVATIQAMLESHAQGNVPIRVEASPDGQEPSH